MILRKTLNKNMQNVYERNHNTVFRNTNKYQIESHTMFLYRNIHSFKITVSPQMNM